MEQLKNSLNTTNPEILIKIINNFGVVKNSILQFTSFKSFIKEIGFQMSEKKLSQITIYLQEIYGNLNNQKEILFEEFSKFILPRKLLNGFDLDLLETSPGFIQPFEAEELKILKNIFLVLIKKLEDIHRVLGHVNFSTIEQMYTVAKGDLEAISKKRIVVILSDFGTPVRIDHVDFILRDFQALATDELTLNHFKAFVDLSVWRS